MARPKKQTQMIDNQQEQAIKTFSDTELEPTVNTEHSSEPTPEQAVDPSTPIETISIAEACTQLAMPEQMLRLALQPSHPEDFDSLKELPLEEFAVIAQTLQRKALGGGESPQEQPQPSQEPKETALTPSPPSSVSTEQRLRLESGAVNALTQFAGEYVLTLDKITSALAFTASHASLKNFVQIHSGVFRNGLEDYLEEFAEEMTVAAHSISQVSAKDFLLNNGIVPKDRRANKAINEILNLVSRA